MSSFNLSGSFERDVNRAVQSQLKIVAAEYQRMFDGMLRTHAGRPVSTIRPILRRNWQRIGGDITDPELTTYAQHISNGTRIQMKV